MKKQKRIITLLVSFAFAGLLFIQASPPERTGDEKKPQKSKYPAQTENRQESGPGSCEQEIGESEQVKKKKLPWLLIAAGTVAAGVILYLTSFRRAKRTLTVELSEGVNGSPSTGKIRFKKGESIPYSFSALEGYIGVSVRLDYQQAPASGKILMDSNHNLTVTARDFPALTVNISENAWGYPREGYYYKGKDEIVYYSYTQATGYNLKVMLDGSEAESKGSIKMDRDHTLEVTVQEVGTVKLAVEIGEGVAGYPSRPDITATRNQAIEYSYWTIDGFRNLRVILDEKEIPASGILVPDSDHTLSATADPPPFLFDIRGDWILEVTPVTSGGCFGSVTIIKPVTFKGPGYYSGTIDFPTGSKVISPGSFKVNYNKIRFDSHFQSTDNPLEFEGITADGTMISGDYTCGKFGNSGYQTGTFRMSRMN